MINFSNCQLLTYNSENNFFGDGISRFKTTANLSIQGFCGDIYGQEGVLAAQSGISGLVASSVDYQPIILNSVVFGNGRVISWSFDPTNEVRIQPYVCNIEIYSTGSLNGFEGAYYGNLRQTMLQPAVGLQFLESMDETFSFAQGKNNLIEQNHSLNIKFISGDDNLSPLVKSRYLASQIFQSGTFSYLPPGAQLATGLLYQILFPSGFIATGYVVPNKRYYSENYNIVDFSTSYNEKFSYDPNGDAYFSTHSLNVETDADGLTNVVDNLTVKALINPIYAVCLSGYQEQVATSFNRASDAFSAYCVGPAFYPLINEPIQNGTTINKYDGSISSQITYSNNPALLSGYRFSYTDTINVEGEIVTVTENGSILGVGKIGTTQKYNKALGGYNTQIALAPARISNLYTQNISPAKTLNQIAATNERSRYRGTINYNLTYSDDPSLIFNGLLNKKVVNISKNFGLYTYGDYIIAGTQNNIGKEILQQGSNTSLQNQNIQITYNYSRAANPSVNTLFQIFVNEVETFLIGESWVGDCQFSINPIDNTFNASATVNTTVTNTPGNIALNWP